MKLIVGLGNVGTQYHNTRHNLGFAVVDMVAIGFGHQPSEFSSHSKAPADVLDLKANYDCILVKPTTMMNLSGEAVGKLARFYKLEPSDIWVIYDDVDIQFSQIRVRLGGGSAGHNGIKSLTEHVGDGFWRVRLGIGNTQLATTPTVQFVLDPFTTEESAKIPTLLNTAADYVASALEQGELTDHTIST
jgi:PTH1 family peptidyl-tRNA hydrolase